MALYIYRLRDQSECRKQDSFVDLQHCCCSFNRLEIQRKEHFDRSWRIPWDSIRRYPQGRSQMERRQHRRADEGNNLIWMRLMKKLLMLILVFAAVSCNRFDMDEILLLRNVESFLCGHNTELLTVWADDSQLLVADFFIDLMSISSDGKAPPNKKIDGTPIRLPYILKKHHEHTTAHNGIFGMLTLSRLLGVRTGTVPALFYQRILTSPEGVVKGYFKIFFAIFHSLRSLSTPLF